MDDLISRQAAVDALQKAYVDTQEGFDKAAVKINVGLTKALHMIQDLPSAQRKTGEWMPGKEIAREYLADGTIIIDYENYKCTSCGLTLKNLLYNIHDEPFYKYCPNCGSEMKGEQDG